MGIFPSSQAAPARLPPSLQSQWLLITTGITAEPFCEAYKSPLFLSFPYPAPISSSVVSIRSLSVAAKAVSYAAATMHHILEWNALVSALDLALFSPAVQVQGSALGFMSFLLKMPPVPSLATPALLLPTFLCVLQCIGCHLWCLFFIIFSSLCAVRLVSEERWFIGVRILPAMSIIVCSMLRKLS